MALRRLAARVGIETVHVDGLGQERTPSDGALLAALRALGFEIEKASEAGALLTDLQATQRPIEACHAFTDCSDTVVPLRCEKGAYKAVLTLESGESYTFSGRIETLPRLADGRAALRLEHLPIGYHRLALEFAGERHQTHVIRSPRLAFGAPSGRRDWGVFAPVYALRREGDWGIGDLGSLQQLAKWVAGLGARYVGTLPLLAGNYLEDYRTSPYSPVSRLFWNELYLQVEPLVATYGDAELAEWIRAPQRQAALADLRVMDYVDYRECARRKREVVEKLAALAWTREPEALQEYADQTPELHRYARFRATMEKTGETWTAWGRSQRNGALETSDYRLDDWRYHVFVQRAMAEQLASLSAGGAELYLDLSVGVSGSSFDCWRYQGQFVDGADIGAPPDALFEGGQNWALAPLHPEHCRQRGSNRWRWPS